MSKALERRIRSFDLQTYNRLYSIRFNTKRIEDGKSRSSIYMICRIFNLGKGDETGMHVLSRPRDEEKKSRAGVQRTNLGCGALDAI